MEGITMDIKVRKFDKYFEMTVEGMSAKIESGTMDEHEAREQAIMLIRAAQGLLPDCHERDELMAVEDIL